MRCQVFWYTLADMWLFIQGGENSIVALAVDDDLPDNQRHRLHHQLSAAQHRRPQTGEVMSRVHTHTHTHSPSHSLFSVQCVGSSHVSDICPSPGRDPEQDKEKVEAD